MSWNSKLYLLLGIVMTVSLRGQAESPIDHAIEGSPKITIRFFNYAQLPAKILNEAKDQTNAIYGKAGVQIEWAECPPGDLDPSGYPACTEVWDATHIFLRILATGVKGTKLEKAGEAILSARIANIYWSRVQHQAELLDIPQARMLAHAIAHEVGHLMLGSNSHCPTGIMVAKWRSQDLVSLAQFGLAFSAQQAEFIRAEVQRRKNMQIASN